MQGYDNLKADSVYRIYIYSTSTNTRVSFPLFLTSFSDSFKSNWNSTSVYGKMDPIVNFKNTTRSISVGFDVPNESITEAKSNMIALDAIIRGMYPVYVSEYGADQGGSNVVASPPMYRVRMANLICNASNDFNTNSINVDTKLASGLLGYIQDFSFNPDIQNGFFIDQSTIIPKLVKVSFTLNVIHEHPLGNTKNSYNVITSRIEDSSFNTLNTFPHKYDTEVSPSSEGSALSTDNNNNVDSAYAASVTVRILG